MMVNKMIYTAIYKNADGRLTSFRHTSSVQRKQAWSAASEARQGSTLIALVAGDHPVYFYEDVGPSIKDIDVFDLNMGSDSSDG